MANLLLCLVVPCLVFSLVPSFAFAADVPQSFTLDGRLYKDTAGTVPLTDGSIQFRVQILDEAKICILYEESQPYSTLASQGYFSIQIGTATGSINRTAGDSANSMASIFQNLNNVSGKKVSDGTPCTVVATGGQRRFVRITIAPASLGGAERVLSPDLTVDSVPNSVVSERAESLQGYRSSEFLKVNTAAGVVLSQSNLESVFTSSSRFTALSDVIDGTSSSYMRSNSAAGAQLPVLAGAPTSPPLGAVWFDSSDSKVKYQTGGGPLTLSTAAAGGGTLSSLTAATGLNTIDNLNYAQTWNWSTATTEVPWSISANALTTGSLFDLTTSSASLNSTNGLFRVANTGAATTGIVARIQANATAGSGLTVLADGKVGIGTTVPAANLTVTPANGSPTTVQFNKDAGGGGGGLILNEIQNGANRSYSIYFRTGNNDRAAVTAGLDGSSASYIALGTQGGEGLRVTQSGNVGIGTTAPGSALDVKGTLRLSGATSGYVGFAPAATAGSTTYTLPSGDGSNGEVLTTDGSGTLTWAAPAGSGSLTSTLADGKLFIGNAGNVATAQTAGGDVSVINDGTFTVNKIKNVSVSATAPTDGQVLKYVNGTTSWTPSNFSIGDLKTATGTQQFAGSAACTAKQTSTWSSLTDTFTCTDIAGLDAGAITTGTIASARLPASATVWTESTGDVYRSTGFVGIGTTAPSAPLQVRHNPATFAAGVSNAVAVGASSAGDVGGTTDLRTVSINAATTGSNNVAGSASLQLDNYNSQTAGTNTVQTAASASVRISSAGNTTNGYGYRAIPILTAAGSMGSWRAYEARSPSFSSTGTIGTATGLYVDVQKVTGVTTGYGVYQLGTADINYFAGNVGIGTSIPSQKLQIDGADAATTAFLRNTTSSAARYPGFSVHNYTNGTAGHPTLSMTNLGGTSSVPTAHAATSAIGALIYSAYDGATTVQLARIDAVSGAAFSSSDHEAVLQFKTSDAAQVNPTEKMRIDQVGNVGIGTIAPATALDLNGAWSIRGMAAPAVSVATQGRIYFDSTDNKFKVSENNGAYVDLVGGGGSISGLTTGYIPKAASATSLGDSIIAESSGKIGIGTATPTNIMNIYSNSNGSLGTVSTTNQNAGALANAGYTAINDAGGSAVFGITSSGFTPVGNLGINTGFVKSSTLALQATGGTGILSIATGGTAERMRIDASGNVGIGTTAPATALDLNGAWSVRGMAAPAVSVAGQGRIYFDSTANKFKVSQNNGAYADLVGGGVSGLTTSYIPKATSATALGDSVISETSGTIGIGTTGTAAKLNIVAGSAIPALLLDSGNFDPTSGAFTMQNLFLSTNNGNGKAFSFTANGESFARGMFYSDGAYGIGSGAANRDLYLKRSAASTLMIDSDKAGAAANLVVTGNTGIGTTSTAIPLTVVGNVSTTSGVLTAQNNYAASYISIFNALAPNMTASQIAQFRVGRSLAANNSAEFNFEYSATNSVFKLGMYGNPNIMSYTYAGNVGIGTSIPATTLDLNGAWSIRGMAAPTVSVAGQGRMYYDSTANKFKVSENTGAYVDLVGGGISGLTTGQIPKATSATAIGDSIITELTGKIGVGTTNPKGPLHVVNGTAGAFTAVTDETIVLQRNATAAANAVMTIVAGSTGESIIRLTNSGATEAGKIGYDNSANKMYFFTNGTEKVRITSAGNVGIGTTIPGSKLQVAGDITPSADNSYTLGGAALRFSDVYSMNAANNTSDIREKKQIEDSDLGLHFVTKLRPVSYLWKSGHDENLHYGLIAQETEQAIAAAKNTEADNRHPVIVTYDEGTDRYGIRYTELISPIIKAIQELYAKILGHDEKLQAQEREIASLKSQFETETARLQRENKELKAYLCAKDPVAPICK